MTILGTILASLSRYVYIYSKNFSVTTSVFVCHTRSAVISSPADTDEVDIRASVAATTTLSWGSSALWFKYGVMLAGSKRSALVKRTGRKSRALNVDLTE